MTTQLDANKTWRIWRRAGLWKAVVFVFVTLALGVIDYLTKGIIPTVATAIQDHFSPPKFTVVFSAPVDVDLTKSTFDAVPRTERRSVTVSESAQSYLVVVGPPGAYHIKLYRKDNRFIPVVLTLKRDESARIETSDDKWTTQEALNKGVESVKPPDNTSVRGEVLRDVRWSTTPTDSAQLSLATTPETKAILATALREVGTHEKQNAARVYEYWGTIPLLRERNNITLQNPGAWGGMFISWVVRQSGFPPPGLGAAYDSWPGWGASVPVSKMEPGMIALFATKEVSGLTGRYLGGVVLRRQPDCTEIITGNVADRVSIACVALPVASLRRPP